MTGIKKTQHQLRHSNYDPITSANAQGRLVSKWRPRRPILDPLIFGPGSFAATAKIIVREVMCNDTSAKDIILRSLYVLRTVAHLALA